MKDTLDPWIDDGDEWEREGVAGDLRRLVTFDLGGEAYAVSVTDVAEIREPLRVTPLPGVAAHVLGLINVRGAILPVVDPRRMLGLGLDTDRHENRLLILKGPGYQVALRVDAVRGLVRLAESEFRAAPAGAARGGAEYYERVAMVDGTMLVELSVEKLIGRNDE